MVYVTFASVGLGNLQFLLINSKPLVLDILIFVPSSRIHKRNTSPSLFLQIHLFGHFRLGIGRIRRSMLYLAYMITEHVFLVVLFVQIDFYKCRRLGHCFWIWFTCCSIWRSLALYELLSMRDCTVWRSTANLFSLLFCAILFCTVINSRTPDQRSFRSRLSGFFRACAIHSISIYRFVVSAILFRNMCWIPADMNIRQFTWTRYVSFSLSQHFCYSCILRVIYIQIGLCSHCTARLFQSVKALQCWFAGRDTFSSAMKSTWVGISHSLGLKQVRHFFLCVSLAQQQIIITIFVSASGSVHYSFYLINASFFSRDVSLWDYLRKHSLFDKFTIVHLAVRYGRKLWRRVRRTCISVHLNHHDSIISRVLLPTLLFLSDRLLEKSRPI